MAFPLAGILYLIGTVIVFSFCYRLHRSYKETQNRFTFYFKNLGLSGGICTLIYGLMCIFFTDNSFVLGIGNIIGEGALMVGFVYAIAFFFYLTFPDVSQKKIFLIGGALVFLSTVSRIIFFPFSTPKSIETSVENLKSVKVLTNTEEYGKLSLRSTQNYNDLKWRAR